MSKDKPIIQIQNAGAPLLNRSPSHESMELSSLLSLNNFVPFPRIPSPIHHRLTVPNAGLSRTQEFSEEDSELSRNFKLLFNFLGSKSFSTSDISGEVVERVVRKSSSELDLTQSDVIFRIPSRSCSTRVFVGDVPSTSQLPSPQGRLGSFTPADLIRSVNKKVRQLYIKKRLSVAYKLTLSGFDLDTMRSGLKAPLPTDSNPVPPPPKEELKIVPQELTLKDVERERGRPLSKLERNIFIFNWLHSLEDPYVEGLMMSEIQ